MNKEDIITIDENEEYMILDTLELNNSKYLYCVLVDKDDMPTKEYRYLKGIKENEEYYVEEIVDEDILSKVIAAFAARYLSSEANNKTDEEQDV